ncbi:hypothetical protein ACRRTK_022440 [Alexandromys fortis]
MVSSRSLAIDPRCHCLIRISRHHQHWCSIHYLEPMGLHSAHAAPLKQVSHLHPGHLRCCHLPTELEALILVPHTAQCGEQRYLFEALFRSQHYALLDNSCCEYLFICEFFVVSGPAAHDLFHAVMGHALAMTLLTRCYAEFFSALVSINQTIPNERTLQLLGQLQVGLAHRLPMEVENFVLRVATEFSSRKEQLVFLINNYDMMLGMLMERAADDSKEVESFQQLLNARTQAYLGPNLVGIQEERKGGDL